MNENSTTQKQTIGGKQLRLFGLILAAVVGAGVLIWKLYVHPDGQPAFESTPSAKLVEQFHVGLAALDVEENQRAATIFRDISSELPQEPAVWANLGVALLRLNESVGAEEAIAKATALAPENGEVVMLFAIADERAGRFDSAIERLRSLSDVSSSTLYMLFELVQRHDPEGSLDERLSLLNRILAREPDNLVAQFERARVTAKLGNLSELEPSLSELGKQGAAWNDQALTLFVSAQAAADKQQFAEVAKLITFLQNVSKSTPAYQASLRSLGVNGKSVGTPVRAFLVAKEPTIQVAEPDFELSFEVRADTEPSLRADVTVALALAAEHSPTLVSVFGDRVRLGSTAEVSFPQSQGDGPVGKNSICAVDLNADFIQDLVFVGPQGIKVYLQDSEGGFAVFTPKEVEAAIFDEPGSGIWALDYEADGDMDLLLSSDQGLKLIRNNGDMTFASIDEWNNWQAVEEVFWTDLDDDGDADLLMLTADGIVTVAWNNRAGEYTSPSALPTDAPCAACAVGDVDFDGVMDVVALTQSGDISSWTHHEVDREWVSSKLMQITRMPSVEPELKSGNATLNLADLDNNGSIDVIASVNQSCGIWLRGTDHSFQKLDTLPSLFVTTVIDMDGDGLQDLVGISKTALAVAHSHSNKDYSWHVVRPIANPNAGDGRINSFGLGGKIEVYAGSSRQAAPMYSPRIHFGLGNHKQAGVVRIRWPNGTVQAEFDLKSNEVSIANQRLKGSCPWVFARNEEGYQFVKDFIWRSPLGLKINSQDTAGVTQTEDWIKIPGELLKPIDGKYEVRITADLWETHFFDHVSLLVVDHPENVEAYVDERFVGAESPDLNVHAMLSPHGLTFARDEFGADVSPELAAIDGVYVDGFALGKYQGLADEHWVEFELNEELPMNGEIYLIGSGWIYPTDSSLNVAISQGGSPAPHGLILEVAEHVDSDTTISETSGDRLAGIEGWKPVSADLGFPAGKNKTVLLPLPSDQLRAGRRRFRLRTNLEIYWDYLGWTVAEPELQLITTRIQADSALLQYRGFSEVSPAHRRRPDVPDYERVVATGARWQDLTGFYTRFGDVRELVTATDDRYVIMNAGDELVIQFAALTETPAGWSRDFVLVGDGWVKDGDFNTTHSATVHPLPTHGNQDYAAPLSDFFDDPVYRQHQSDWEQFHTRFVNGKPNNFANISSD
ncbi:MAG: VCBS repeat-containing protein [Planctomycetaceae bacterium]|nr:VCBS repeat-containing protein [Planctomycetaceae bacterium]MCB9953609.1 VCBS repeat-containing protein [Planctomycetaceae bacterium]